jgi:heme/copper-type cytochrome/quinol oxidase subunit 3
MLDRQTLLLMTISVCVVNGIFSPYLKVAIPISAALLPELFPRTVEWVLFWGSILLSSATLLFSGVLAALYERLVQRDEKNDVSMWIWLTGASALSLPAALRLL